jgi:hypothetical protein
VALATLVEVVEGVPRLDPAVVDVECRGRVVAGLPAAMVVEVVGTDSPLAAVALAWVASGTPGAGGAGGWGGMRNSRRP